MNKFFIFVTLLLSLSLMGAFAADVAPIAKKEISVTEMGMAKSPGKFDPVQYLNEMQGLYDWLKAEAAGLSERSIVSVEVTEDEFAEVDNYQCKTCGPQAVNTKMRVGISKPLDANVNLNSHGEMRTTQNGGFIWTMAFQSNGSTAIRLHVMDLTLPEGVQLYVYGGNGEAFGPYTDRGPNMDGDFWTNATAGPVVYLQLHAGPGVGTDAINFNVTEIGHIGSKFLIPFFRNQNRNYEDLSVAMHHCSYNENCVEDGACYGTGQFAGYNDAKYGVAHILFISGRYWYMCSGGLLNNTAQDFTPYFLTANHCVGRKEAKTVETYFQYFNPSCHASCVSRGTADTVGSTYLKGSGSSSDYTLLRLNQAPPAGSVFMGWNATAVAYSNGTPLYRLSHPSGAPQAYSKHQVDTSKPVCSSWPRGKWIYSQDVVGATEGGSSGSVVCNASGQVVGQLSGACGYNPGDPCDSQNNGTVDGAFADYFSSISSWLAPI